MTALVRGAAGAGLLLALLGPGEARADPVTFRVLLGGGEIGALVFDDGGGAPSLSAQFAGTPLSVADGTFSARSGPAAAADGTVVTQYLWRSDFTLGGRTIRVLSRDGRATEVTVEPAADRTELSDPAAVPPGALDPAQAFAALASAESCPSLTLYDGRRAVRIETAAAGEGTCSGRYEVIAGPAHLSPLSIQGFALDLAYAGGTLSGITVRTGPFELRLER